MTLTIVGAGGIGSVIAAQLTANGERVWLLATPRTAARLRTSGAVELSGLVETRVPIGARPAPGVVGLADAPQDVDDAGGMVFATKAHQLASAARFWSGVRPQWVAGLQNGMAKNDILADVFGAAAVAGATTIIGAERAATGTVRFTGRGHTYFGEPPQRAGQVQPVVDAMNRAGLPATLLADVRRAEWSKAANAAGGMAVTVLGRADNRRQRTDPDLVRVFLQLAREAAAIAAAEGVTLGDYERFPIQRFLSQDEATTIRELGEAGAAMPAGTEKPSSMYWDLLREQPLEVEEVFGDLVARAARNGIPVPGLQIVYRLIRSLDPARRAPAIV
jgi:2-dehydropantoate 2-reductase